MKKKSPSLRTKIILLPIFLMPRGLKILFANFLVWIWKSVFKIRVEITTEQIKKVFPEMKSKAVNSILKGSYFNLVMVLLEYSYIPFSKKKIIKYTELRGIKYYVDALKKNKSVFLLTGHMGNGEMALARMSVEGFSLNLIGKRVGNKFLDSVLFETRETWGLDHIPPRDSMSTILKLIEKKETIVFVNDQFIHPPRGVKTKFLGVDAYTNSAPAKLALKTGAAVIPVNVFRENGNSIIEFSPEILTEKKFQTEEENIIYMTQKYNDWFQEVIFKRPDQWMWVHKRWKKVEQ